MKIKDAQVRGRLRALGIEAQAQEAMDAAADELRTLLRVGVPAGKLERMVEDVTQPLAFAYRLAGEFAAYRCGDPKDPKALQTLLAGREQLLVVQQQSRLRQRSPLIRRASDTVFRRIEEVLTLPPDLERAA